MYGLCMFSMVVPFQMVMFTLAKTADSLKLNNPYNICIIYLASVPVSQCSCSPAL